LNQELAQAVDRCLDGDQTAMVELVERYRSQVFGLCYRMLTQRQDAEDMTQETFLRVFRNLHRWDRTRPFEPWLLAIAGNRCRTLLSTRKRRPVATDLVDHLPDERPDQAPADQLAEEVHLALGRMREEYRQAFLLFHDQQLSYVEIAASLDCPVGTAKTWVHRARRELADHLCERGAVERPEGSAAKESESQEPEPQEPAIRATQE